METVGLLVVLPNGEILVAGSLRQGMTFGSGRPMLLVRVGVAVSHLIQELIPDVYDIATTMDRRRLPLVSWQAEVFACITLTVEVGDSGTSSTRNNNAKNSGTGIALGASCPATAMVSIPDADLCADLPQVTNVQ